MKASEKLQKIARKLQNTGKGKLKFSVFSSILWTMTFIMNIYDFICKPNSICRKGNQKIEPEMQKMPINCKDLQENQDREMA